MASKVKIYGCSDDLVELDGDISDEIPGNDEDGLFLQFNEGTVIKASYVDPGIWKLDVIHEGAASVEKTQTAEGDNEPGGTNDDPDAPPYSDVLTVTHCAKLKLVRTCRDEGNVIVNLDATSIASFEAAQKILKVVEDGGDDDEKLEDVARIVKEAIKGDSSLNPEPAGKEGENCG